jgi:Big-like domain-containing protein
MLARPNSRLQPLLLVLAALALAACNSNTNEPNFANGIKLVSGDDQFANVGTAAANPLVVMVVDQNGQPFPNGTVTWKVTGGGGTVADTVSTSDAQGHASMTYTAGPTAGTATIAATAAQLWTTNFTVRVVAP